MEDLVLNHIMMRFRTRRTTSSSKCEVDDYTGSKWDRRSVSPVESGETNATHKLPIAPASPVSEVSTSNNHAGLLPTESSDDLYGLTPVQTKQNIYEIEHQKPHDANLEKKRSITSVKKLALRFSSRLGSRDSKVPAQGRVLQKARPAAQSTVSISPYASTSGGNSSQRSEPSLPTQPTSVTSQAEAPKAVTDSQDLSEVPPPKPETESETESMPKTELRIEGKPLPASPQHEQAPPIFGLPPDFGVSADHNLAKLLPPIQASSDLANSIDAKLTSIRAGSLQPTAVLNDELEATKLKLSQLFESQALLRERYNSEKDKTTKLDAEHQLTHTRIHSLEQSARDMNDELRRLYEYVGSLERANKELRGSTRPANEGLMYIPHNELVPSAPSTRPVSASPPISEIQPLRPNPPPIPKKADRRSLNQYGEGSPISRSNSHEQATTGEDLSYWRVGDITTIAEVGSASGTGTPRPLWDHRRSASMSDDMLRKANAMHPPVASAPQGVRPNRSSSVRAQLPLIEQKPEFMSSTASIVSSRPGVKGFPQASYAPVAASPYSPYSPYEDSALDLSEQLTPVPTQVRRESVVPVANGAPVRPATATRTSTQSYRPQSNQADATVTSPGKGRAANAFTNSGAFAPSWPDYYVEDQQQPAPVDLRRQSTIKAKAPPVQTQAHRASTYPMQGEDLTRKRSPPSVQSSFYSADLGDDTYHRSASRAPSVAGVAQTHSSSSGSGPRQRKLKLKTSLELLPNCAKKEIALDASRQAAIVGKPVSPTSNFIQNRGFALYRFINPQPVGRDMLSYELERLKPSMSTSKVMISEPTTLRVTFPRAMKGVEGTVGMYDSVSEMWLNPHALKKKR